MVERIQDLNLPNSNITKIIKDSLPADINMDKEARIAIARATSVFIMYLSSNAAATAHKNNHKTFSAQNVVDAISEMDFKNFIGPMKASLVQFQKSMKDKKVNKKISLEARKSLGNQQQQQQQLQQSIQISIPQIPATTSVTLQKAIIPIPIPRTPITQNNPAKVPINFANDIIEIDDSD